MRISIDAFEAISPVAGFGGEVLNFSVPLAESGFLRCVEPVYKEHIDPKLLRRMSRVIKMGVATASATLKKSGLSSPDAILIGTGLGCVQDTETFLSQMDDNNETLLNPTAFIQSTHNTLSGQIALMLSCKSYNFTFTQKTISFESALLEAVMMLDENRHLRILVGAIDEMLPQVAELMAKNGCARNETANRPDGFVAGEGTAFFTLSNQDNVSAPYLSAFEICYGLNSDDERLRAIDRILSSAGISIAQVDLVLNGRNGVPELDRAFASTEQLGCKNLRYKDYCGEHDSSGAFALWLACGLLKRTVLVDGLKDAVKTILIHNRGKNCGDVFMVVQI